MCTLPIAISSASSATRPLTDLLNCSAITISAVSASSMPGAPSSMGKRHVPPAVARSTLKRTFAPSPGSSRPCWMS
ncbi:hypothetical protein DM02DRAFT_355987 [Periconia macrospinosa]|uniref:Uncharacterized protein n=1 Tax=Periconia macrospinosa TaxID=97972 RepID=A0A2V1E9I6_9PLEO|nr:hypothetical protein DM02DRAFT_355987 [Periconia macrospinosa]